MGNITKSLTAPHQTTFDIELDRKCAQAGSALKGTVSLTIGGDFKQLLNAYPAGLHVSLHLFGSEKVFWAKDHSHLRPVDKRLVPGLKRRE